VRKLILKMSVSVDGFVCDTNGGAGWIFATMDDEAARWTIETLSRAGIHLMGSRTYYDMAAWWPTSTEIFAPPMNEIPKAVATTRTAAELFRTSETTQAVKDAAHARGASQGATPTEEIARSWSNPTVLSGDLATGVTSLKQQSGKDIIAHGGARFAQSLIKTCLVDEFHLLIHPVAIGSGLALFAGLQAPLNLQLVNSTSFPKGCVAHVYQTRNA
jgi:dihydrofolate reductase